MEDRMDTGVAFVLGLFAFMAVSAWASKQAEQRKMAYRQELYLKMVQDPGPGAEAVRALLDREAQRREKRAIGATRTGGMIVCAVGVTMGVFLYFIQRERPIFLLGLVPAAVGFVMFLHGLMLARQAAAAKRRTAA
jgi:hypothetical protein